MLSSVPTITHKPVSLLPIVFCGTGTYEEKMETSLKTRKCHNCGIELLDIPGKINVMSVGELVYNHQRILAKWTEYPLFGSDEICAACLYEIEKCESDENPPRRVGHKMVCTGCAKSVLNKRHILQSAEFIQTLFPCKQHMQLKNNLFVLCYDCHIKIKRCKEKTSKEFDRKEDSTATTSAEHQNSIKKQKIVNTVAKFEDNNIFLPGHRRPPVKRTICMIPNCRAKGLPVSRSKKKLIYLKTNSLIGKRASLCQKHKDFTHWNFGLDYFTMQHVEDALLMCERPVATIDFDCVNDMPDHICKYWTGLTVEEFKDLYEKLNVDTSQFHSLRNALAVHLLRKKTGDSLVKLANLFLISTHLLSKQLLVIERCIETLQSNGKS